MERERERLSTIGIPPFVPFLRFEIHGCHVEGHGAALDPAYPGMGPEVKEAWFWPSKT